MLQPGHGGTALNPASGGSSKITSSRPAWVAHWVPGQQRQYETLPHKNKTKQPKQTITLYKYHLVTLTI